MKSSSGDQTLNVIPDTYKDQSVKNSIINTLDSYNDPFDIFSESIQNALDAISDQHEFLRALKQEYKPELVIIINYQNDEFIQVVDNGKGMNEEQLSKCLAPNVGDKRGMNKKGNKGVGATFLAFGFKQIEIITADNYGFKKAVDFTGYSWINGETSSCPLANVIDKNLPFTFKTGSSFKIYLGTRHCKPASLYRWISDFNPSNWFKKLCYRTPLGIVHENNKFKTIQPETKIIVIDEHGNSKEHTGHPLFVFPDEYDFIRKKIDFESLDSQISNYKRTHGKDAEPTFLYGQNAITGLFYGNHIEEWETWDEDEKRLIESKFDFLRVSFLDSAERFDFINDHIGIPHNRKVVIKPGYIAAIDEMVQGEIHEIDLRKYHGDITKMFMLFSLKNAKPDTGRKTFDSEIAAFMRKLSSTAARRFSKKRKFLAASPTMTAHGSAVRIRDWKEENQEHRKSYPLALPKLAYISMPKLEQDVICIFHELIGMNKLPGYRFLSTTSNDLYDSLFLMHLTDDERYQYNCSQPYDSKMLGCEFPQIPPGKSFYETAEFVLEYKKSLDQIWKDVNGEDKIASDINLLVVWDIGDLDETESNGTLTNLLSDPTFAQKRVFLGSTHIFNGRCPITTQIIKWEIISLSDLIRFFISQPKP